MNSGNADNIVNNGVVQSIDTVLMPPTAYLTATTLAQVLILEDDKFKDILLAFMFGEMINLLESRFVHILMLLLCLMNFDLTNETFLLYTWPIRIKEKSLEIKDQRPYDNRTSLHSPVYLS